MKSTFEKELEGEKIFIIEIEHKGKIIPVKCSYYKPKDVLSAKNKDDTRKKQEILKTIGKDEFFHCKTCCRGVINVIKRVL